MNEVRRCFTAYFQFTHGSRRAGPRLSDEVFSTAGVCSDLAFLIPLFLKVVDVHRATPQDYTRFLSENEAAFTHLRKLAGTTFEISCQPRRPPVIESKAACATGQEPACATSARELVDSMYAGLSIFHYVDYWDPKQYLEGLEAPDRVCELLLQLLQPLAKPDRSACFIVDCSSDSRKITVFQSSVGDLRYRLHLFVAQCINTYHKYTDPLTDIYGVRV